MSWSIVAIFNGLVGIAAAARELILLYGLLGEGHDLFFGLSLILRKRHPLASDLPAGSREISYPVLLGVQRGNWARLASRRPPMTPRRIDCPGR